MAIAGSREPGWWYPWLFVGGLGIVVIVNGFLTYFAVNSWTGLSTEDHYAKGLAFNQTLDAKRQQGELGWKVDFNFNPDGNLSVHFTGKDGAPLDGLMVMARMYRPSQDDVDYDVGAGTPNWVSGQSSYMQHYAADRGDTANDPKLIVTYESALDKLWRIRIGGVTYGVQLTDLT